MLTWMRTLIVTAREVAAFDRLATILAPAVSIIPRGNVIILLIVHQLAAAIAAAGAGYLLCLAQLPTPVMLQRNK